MLDEEIDHNALRKSLIKNLMRSSSKRTIGTCLVKKLNISFDEELDKELDKEFNQEEGLELA